MNVFFFLNADLEDGILYSNNSPTKAKLSELSNISDIYFVLPNDLVTHRFHSDQSVNLKNIKAAIINDVIIENNNFDIEYIVLGPIQESNFLLVEKTNYDLIKSKLSKYGETLRITSDALLLHAITKSDFRFNNYVFKESGGTIFKFQEKMATLVKGEFKEFDLKKLSNLNTELFVEIDLFTPKSLLNLQKYKFSNYALLAAIILSVFSGLINLININNKISSIDLYQQELFASYFINDAYQDADKIINSYGYGFRTILVIFNSIFLYKNLFLFYYIDKILLLTYYRKNLPNITILVFKSYNNLHLFIHIIFLKFNDIMTLILSWHFI